MAAALIVPFAARHLHVQLSDEDVSTLVALSLGAAHALAPTLESFASKFVKPAAAAPAGK